MFEFAALTYGVIATFVMSSVTRNKREARRNPMILAAFGWALMAFSMTVGVGLLGYAGYQTMVGGSVAAF
jgi:hypothetical protein